MERAFGRHAAGLFTRYRHAYMVESTDGQVVTKGWRTRRIPKR